MENTIRLHYVLCAECGTAQSPLHCTTLTGSLRQLNLPVSLTFFPVAPYDFSVLLCAIDNYKAKRNLVFGPLSTTNLTIFLLKIPNKNTGRSI